MVDVAIGGLVTRHIDELEAAIKYAHQVMQPALSLEVTRVIEDRRILFGWAGSIGNDLDEDSWLAAEEWSTANDTDDYFDLFLELDCANCIDGSEPETWLGIMCGYAGASLRFGLASNALGVRDWKALLRSESEIVEALCARNFSCDPKTGFLGLKIRLDREAIAKGFDEEDLEAALSPIGAALDQIKNSKVALDGLVKAIRARTKL